jgi:hypothetical protein
VEAVVSIALLAIIGGAIGATFDLGFRVLAEPGSSKDRLAQSRDQLALEQELSGDAGRAACIMAPVTGHTTAYGSCQSGFAAAAPGPTCSRALLCFGWPAFSSATPEGGTCYVAAYTSSGGNIQRTLFSGGSAVSGTELTTNGVSITRASGPDPVVFTPSSGVPWISSLRLQVASVPGGSEGNAPTELLDLKPLATDPGGSIADIMAGGAAVC